MKKNSINRLASSFGMNIIIRFRFVVLFLVGLLVFGGYLGMGRITLETSTESSFPDSEEVVQRNERFKELFGNEEFVYILIEADEVFDHDTLTYIREISQDLEENLPFVKEISALTDIEYIDVVDGDLYVDDLVGQEIPADEAALAEIKAKTLAKDVYVDRIVTRDATKTGIAITFTTIPEVVYVAAEEGFNPLQEADWPADKVLMREHIFSATETQDRTGLVEVRDPRKLITPALRVILSRHQNPAYTVTATGVPVFEFGLDAIISRETSRAVLLTLIIALVLLIAIFRSFSGVIAPFLVVFAAIIITYGTMGWLNIPMSTASIVIATLLLVIAVSYSIHVINHFQQVFRQHGNRRQAVKYAFEHAAWPCFVTAATTALGFASFVIVEILPIKYLGIVCAIGALVTYLLVMTIIPIFCSFGRDRKMSAQAAKSGEASGSSGMMAKWADIVTNHARLVATVSVILVAVAGVCSMNMQVDSDWTRIIGNRVPFVRDTEHITNHLGALYSYEVLIELPEPDMAKEPSVLQTMEALDALIGAYSTTKQTMSLNSVVKDINMMMNNNELISFVIPPSRELIAQYLLLYEMSGGGELNNWVDYDYQNLRLSVQARKYTIALREQFDEIERFGQAHFPAGTTVTITGDIPILLRSAGALVDGQILSVLAALVSITCVMMIVLRSVRVGLLSMIPNILPVGIVTGVMGAFQIPLENFTILVAPILIGIAVDDTVHYFLHFRQEFQKGRSYRDANRETFRKIGRAIVFTSVILTLGFSAFGLSVINSMVHLAILLGVGIMAALAADLCITPVLFTFLKPFGKTEGERAWPANVQAVEIQES